MTTREEFVSRLRSVIGSPYIWGGQDPAVGFDCSGLIVWAMRLPRDDSAAGLYKTFRMNTVPEREARLGTLWFYGDKPGSRITHVMALLQQWKSGEGILCGARGGGSGTLLATPGAFVDVVSSSLYNRRALRFIVDPF
jgi:cell wall-associated NlpC family hydrolase